LVANIIELISGVKMLLPCFIQTFKSKKIIKSNSKGIANKDRENKKISHLTDKKGFLRLISSDIFDKLADTNKMEKLNCKELLNYSHNILHCNFE